MYLKKNPVSPNFSALCRAENAMLCEKTRFINNKCHNFEKKYTITVAIKNVATDRVEIVP